MQTLENQNKDTGGLFSNLFSYFSPQETQNPFNFIDSGKLDSVNSESIQRIDSLINKKKSREEKSKKLNKDKKLLEEKHLDENKKHEDEQKKELINLDQQIKINNDLLEKDNIKLNEYKTDYEELIKIQETINQGKQRQHELSNSLASKISETESQPQPKPQPQAVNTEPKEPVNTVEPKPQPVNVEPKPLPVNAVEPKPEVELNKLSPEQPKIESESPKVNQSLNPPPMQSAGSKKRRIYKKSRKKRRRKRRRKYSKKKFRKKSKKIRKIIYYNI